MKQFQFFHHSGHFTSCYLLPTVMVSAMGGRHHWIAILWLRTQVGVRWVSA